MSALDAHELRMKRALELARQGLGRTHPNPAVGCVITHGGEIVVAEPGLFRVHFGEITHPLILAPGTLTAADRLEAGRPRKQGVARVHDLWRPIYGV